jgi:Asp/Glu/hydantoin racemase
MRLLLLNPNTSKSVTDRIASAARSVAGPETKLVPVTAPKGVPYIATRAEATLGGAVALEMLAEMHRDFDAAIIAAFGDPGLGGARELFPIPVIGLAEAGMLTACMLGRAFAIVTFSSALEPGTRNASPGTACRPLRWRARSPAPSTPFPTFRRRGGPASGISPTRH